MKPLLNRIKTLLSETDITYLTIGLSIASILVPLLLSYAVTLILGPPLPKIFVAICGCLMALTISLIGVIQIKRRQAPGLGPGYPITGIMAVFSGWMMAIIGLIMLAILLFSFFFS